MTPSMEESWHFDLLLFGMLLVAFVVRFIVTRFRNGRSGKEPEIKPAPEPKGDPYLTIWGEVRYRDSEDNTPMGASLDQPYGPQMIGHAGKAYSEAYAEKEGFETIVPAVGLTKEAEDYFRKQLIDFQNGTLHGHPVGYWQPNGAKLGDEAVEPITGTLKVWPDFFQLQWDGEKTFELRRNDRNFQEGQIYYLAEYRPDWTNLNPEPGHPFCSDDGVFTGRKLIVRLKYVMHGPAFGLAKDWVVFGHNILARISSQYVEGDFKPILKP